MKSTLAIIQTHATNDVKSNIERQLKLSRKAADEGAHIICLQELSATTYFCQHIDEQFFDWAEPIPGPLTDTFSEAAKQKGVVICLPIFEKAAPGIYYNSLAVIDADGSLLGTYRKMHIPEDPGFHEKYYFTPGDQGYKVFDTKFGKIGTLICWDQWFPEAARLTAMKGADLLIYPTAIGTLPFEGEQLKQEYLQAWQTVQKSHAIANGCFVASINRVGTEDDIRFWGHSFVAGPFGQLLAEAGEEEEILLQEIDYSTIEQQRRIWPFFRDRRTDSYKNIMKRFDAGRN